MSAELGAAQKELDNAAEVKRFTIRNRRFCLTATVVIGVILTVMTVYFFAIVRVLLISGVAPVRLILAWLPSVYYLWALWTLRALFAELARGGPAIQLSVTRALSKIGCALMLGALATMVSTAVISLLAYTHRTGNFAAFDVPAFTLGMIGLGLLIVAPMLERSIRIEAEARSLKDILKGFV